MQHQPALCNCLHPGTAVGEKRTNPKYAVVAVRQCAKHHAASPYPRLGFYCDRTLDWHLFQCLNTERLKPPNFDATISATDFADTRRSELWRTLTASDDLHWADRGTLWLMGHLLRQIRDERVLIVGAYRETELDRAHPLAKSLVDWNRERLVTRITLRRFNQLETGNQLDALLGEHVSGEFAEAVHRETEGNPFFVEEVLKALIERGSVRRESGRWKKCDVTELVIPQSVKEAIGHRLDRVNERCNEVLRVAAHLR